MTIYPQANKLPILACNDAAPIAREHPAPLYGTPAAKVAPGVFRRRRTSFASPLTAAIGAIIASK